MITIYKKPPLFEGWWIFNNGTQITDKQVAGCVGKSLHWWERLNWKKTCDATLASHARDCGDQRRDGEDEVIF